MKFVSSNNLLFGRTEAASFATQNDVSNIHKGVPSRPHFRMKQQ